MTKYDWTKEMTIKKTAKQIFSAENLFYRAQHFLWRIWRPHSTTISGKADNYQNPTRARN
jgi:hypothetical protein